MIVTSDSSAVLGAVKTRAPRLPTGLIVRWRDPRAPRDVFRIVSIAVNTLATDQSL